VERGDRPVPKKTAERASGDEEERGNPRWRT
jgi:hypothetical protein